MAIEITKSSGEHVPFDENKIRASILRTGADEKTVDAILPAVVKKVEPGMSTRALYKIVREELKKAKPWAAARYDLREGIFRLGPAGFNFEKYVAAILNAYGYRAETPDGYNGACIPHEVDVTAEKDGRSAFIEAKFRHNFQSTITIKDTLATWARFLDLVDGARIGLCPHFDEAWIVTNARFTQQSLQYGHCKNMVLIGWNHPRERSFAKMVDLDSLYPLTVIDEITKEEMETFAKADLLLCRDVADMEPAELNKLTGMPEARLEQICRICEDVVDGDGPNIDKKA